jgi:hypothetical protein
MARWPDGSIEAVGFPVALEGLLRILLGMFNRRCGRRPLLVLARIPPRILQGPAAFLVPGVLQLRCLFG